MFGIQNTFIPLQVKLIVLFCLMITIPFFISGTITYNKYSSDVEQNTRTYTTQIIEQIKINLDQYTKDIERLTLAPFYNENVLKILDNHSGSYENKMYLPSEELLTMNLFNSSLLYDRQDIRSIVMFANDGSLFSNSENTVNKHWAQDSNQWMNEVKQADGGLVIIPPHLGTYYTEPQQVISMARLIKEPFSGKLLGIVKVDLMEHGFEKILSSVNIGMNSKLYILDRSGQQLYPHLQESLPSSKDMTIMIQDKLFLGASAESDYTGLNVIGLVPIENLRKDAKELISFTLVISLFSLIIAYVLAVLLSKQLVKPIRHLQIKMNQVKRGFLNERAKVTANDEIGQLTSGFNVMVTEIQRLVNEVYETKLREREAELSALQSQINPHFLYNTLETINMMALDFHHLELSNVATNLGKMLRYTVNIQQKTVYLRDEILFVESYLQIQTLRSGNELLSDIRIDPSIEYCLVPKLFLQPIVENVIEHGMTGEVVRINLTAEIYGDQLILSVKDDGRGMTPQKIEEVEGLMYAVKNNVNANQIFGQVSKGYALRNIHQRIRLLYGEPYGLYIDKTQKKGTLFIIRLPFLWE